MKPNFKITLEKIMPYYSSLFQYLDAKLPWSSTIAIRSFLSRLPILNWFVSPADKTISELRNQINQAKSETSNLDYVIYYKWNMHYLISRLNLVTNLFSYSEAETNRIQQSKSISNADNKLTDLCEDNVCGIIKFLPKGKNNSTANSIDEQIKLPSFTMKNIYRLFQPVRLLNTLLNCIDSGRNQDIAEKILNRYPELLMQKGSRRKFKDITALQFLLCTMREENDFNYYKNEKRFVTGKATFLCSMILKCLPKNEKGEQIRISLSEQLHEFKNREQIMFSDNRSIFDSKDYNCHYETVKRLGKFLETPIYKQSEESSDVSHESGYFCI